MKKISACSLAFLMTLVFAVAGFAYDLTGGGYGQVQKTKPSVAFVLTTWEKKGIAISQTVTKNTKVQGSREEASEEGFDGSRTDIETNNRTQSDVTIGVFTEDVWKKIPDAQIVDKFQQQFVKQQFNVKASDLARNIALAPSLAKTGVDPSDRAAVRKLAEKEGVNYVARGEVAVLNYQRATGNKVKASLQIGVEVINVNSGEIVASFSNAVHTVAASMEVARNGGINKAAVVAARNLSEQVMEAWINAADNGSQYIVELRNMKSARSQKMPFEKALKGIATLNSQTQPQKDIVTYTVVFKGSKSDLGMAILEAVGDKPGFDEKSFDGPGDDEGKITFEFLK